MREFDFENKKDSLYNPLEFLVHFDEHMKRITNENVEKYNMIGINFLKQIEESIFETSTMKREEMKEYYYYWETRVYNALIKMVLRALLTYKNLINQPVP